MAFLHCKDDEDEADEGSDGTHYASLNRVTEKEPPLHQACQCDEQVGSVWLIKFFPPRMLFISISTNFGHFRHGASPWSSQGLEGVLPCAGNWFNS